MRKKVRAGLIGCGLYGRNLIRFLEKMDCYDLVAVADPDVSAMQEGAALLSYNVKRYNCYEELIAANTLDAVIIAAPNDLHAAQAISAMEAGLAVYLEKPIACAAADCRRVMEVQRRTGARVMVGMQLRYGEVYAKAKQILDEGVIGRVRLLWYREFRAPFFPGTDGWRLSAERSGGTILEKSVHHFDLFNWYADSEPVSVFASGGSDAVYAGSGLLDNAVVTINYASGARACYGLSLFSAGSDQNTDFTIVGDCGVLEMGEGKITVRPNNEPGKVITYQVAQPYADMGHGGTEFSALTAFYELVARNKPPLTGLSEGYRSVGMALAAQRSAQECRPVSLAELAEGDEENA